MAPTFFWTLLISVFVYALLRGGTEHRIAAVGCVAATFASHALRPPASSNYYSIEVGLLVVDIALFALFLALALRSNRFWPLWVAGFHLVTVAAHAIRALKFDLVPTAYAVAAQFWSYPVLLCIGIAIWRFQRRRIAETLAAPPPPAASA